MKPKQSLGEHIAVRLGLIRGSSVAQGPVCLRVVRNCTCLETSFDRKLLKQMVGGIRLERMTFCL